MVKTEQDAEETGGDVAAQQHVQVQKDSGWKAWSQVLGTFCLYFNTWGVVACYGSFQTFYEAELLKSNSSFQISTIGSLQSFLLVFFGFIAGPIYDAGYSRHLLIGGTLLIVVGTVAQSFCSELWQLLITQGFCIGLGCGCLVVPSAAIPPLWFTRRLPLANAIAASGSGLGGVILPIINRQLLYHIGFGWTVRVIALVCFVFLLISHLVLEHPKLDKSKQRRRLLDLPSLTDWPYVFFVLGCFIVFLGIYTPLYYVQSYALHSKIISEGAAWYLVTATNAGSILGRVLTAFLAQAIGPLNTILFTTGAMGACALAFIGGQTVAGVYVVAILFGFFMGAFFSLQPTVFARLTSDHSILGTRFGMAFTVLSIALLFGSPIAGALQDVGGYNASWIWAGVTILAGGLLIAVSRMLKAGSQRKV